MDKVRVNVHCNVSGTIRHEKLNGRDVIIVPSATMPDDVVMNAIHYPSDEIASSFMGLDRTPAPLGHPQVNGQFVSAKDPEGINMGWVGAWNTNVRRERGRVFLDKVIDVEKANESENGKRLLKAIENGESIHTSTGLLCNLEAVNDNSDYKNIARNIVFDHDAILLDEAGAATPEQGVGMMVNHDGTTQEIMVVNSTLSVEEDQQLDWAIEEVARALEKREKAPILERIKAAILEAFAPARENETITPNQKESAMDKEQFDALKAQVDELTKAQTGFAETVANAVAEAVKPLTDNMAEMAANQEAKDKAELEELVEKIVKSNLLDKETAEELTLNAARKLAEKAKPKPAAALNGAFVGNDDKPSFQLPKGEDA